MISSLYKMYVQNALHLVEVVSYFVRTDASSKMMNKSVPSILLPFSSTRLLI